LFYINFRPTVCREKPLSFYSYYEPVPYLMMADVDSRNI